LKLRGKILLALLVAAVVIAIVYGLKKSPVHVETSRIERGPLRVTVEEDGRTRVRDRYTVTAPVAGYLRRIGLEEGDSVTAGEVIAQLEPSGPESLDVRARARAGADIKAAEAALKSATGDAKAAEAGFNYASSNRARTEELFGKGVVSEDELEKVRTETESARASLESARFRVEVARHELEAARTALKYTASDTGDAGDEVGIASPVDGRVFRVFRESEGIVSAADPLVEIGDPSAIEVEVDLLSADAVRVGPGTKVVFERWGGGTPLTGRVRVVEPSGFTKISALGVEEQRVFVISDITSPPKEHEGLGDGYRVDASFIVWESADVLRVPESALFRKEDGWAVFTVEEDRAALRSIKLGHRNGIHAEVLSGLSVDEEVIVHPGRDVEDGVSITRWREGEK